MNSKKKESKKKILHSAKSKRESNNSYQKNLILENNVQLNQHPTPKKEQTCAGEDVGSSSLSWLYDYCHPSESENLFDDPMSLSLLVSPSVPMNIPGQSSYQLSYTPNIDIDLSLSLSAPFSPQMPFGSSSSANKTPPLSSRQLMKDSSCLSALIKGEVRGKEQHSLLTFSPSLFSPHKKLSTNNSTSLSHSSSADVDRPDASVLSASDYFNHGNTQQDFFITNDKVIMDKRKDPPSSSSDNKTQITTTTTMSEKTSSICNKSNKEKKKTNKVKKNQHDNHNDMNNNNNTSFSSPFTAQTGDGSLITAIASAATDLETKTSSDPMSYSAATSLASLGGGSADLPCKCKKSRCLKLYCDCFAILRYCGKLCSCRDCANNLNEKENLVLRERAIRTIKEKNHLAFQTKITEKEGTHAAGCHCKQSHCLKKYCECFHGGAMCGTNCKCQNCRNFLGSEDLDRVRVNCTFTTSSDPCHQSQSQCVSDQTQSPDSDNNNNNKESPEQQGYHDNEVIKMMKKNKNKKNSLSSSSSSSPEVEEEEGRSQKKVKFHHHHHQHQQQQQEVVHYPFFGHTLPPTPKLVALKILDFLPSKDIYSMSIVNSLLSQAAMDDALWD